MQSQSIFQLLTPMIYLLFAAGFTGIWATSRKLKSALVFAVAYAVNSFAFLMDLLRDLLPNLTVSYVTNILFLTAVTASVVGCWLRARRPIPVPLLSAIVVLHLAGLHYFAFVEPDMFMRTVWVNCLLGLIFAVSLPAVFALNRGPLDRVIAWAFVLATAQFYVRPALVFWLAGTQMNVASYTNSPFHIALHFTAAIVALVIATSLLASYALKIVSDLRKTSQTDPLTGCLNRRGLEERSVYLQEFCKRGDKPMAIVMADIDHFKRVNDRFGHNAGDEVIRRLGNILTDAAGLTHVAGRMGGEEFVLVMSDTDLDAGRATAEKLRREFGRQEFVLGGTTECLSMSMGVASLDPDGSLSDAIQRADRALYASKAHGRDCVTDEIQASVKDLRSLNGFTKRNAAALLTNSG
ncbi:MAG: GGDEF domain-containing protein [Pseudomonadota bacterium]